MSSRVKVFVRRYTPPLLRRFVRAWHSFRVVRDFAPDRWPPAFAVSRILGPGDGVVDGGANIGYVSKWLAHWVGPSGRVFSFEPEPETAWILRRNMAKLGLSQVVVFPYALADQPGEGDLIIPEYADGGENPYEARLVGPREQGGRRVRVVIETLDRAVGAYDGRLRLIKLDLEGGELKALIGAQRLLQERRPVLLLEINAGAEADALTAFLRSHGYEGWSATNEGWKPWDGSSGDVFFWPFPPA